MANNADRPPAGDKTPWDWLNPIRLLRESIRAVPQLKYALGVVGLVSAVAIVSALRVSPRVAGWGTLILVFFMVLAVLFAKLAKQPQKVYRTPGTILLWVVTVIVSAQFILITSSIWFRWPQDLSHWLIPPTSAATVHEEDSVAEADVIFPEATHVATDLSPLFGSRVRVVSATDSEFVLGLERPNALIKLRANGDESGPLLEIPAVPEAISVDNSSIWIGAATPDSVLLVSTDPCAVEKSVGIPGRAAAEGLQEILQGEAPATRPASICTAEDFVWVIVEDANNQLLHRCTRALDQCEPAPFLDWDFVVGASGWRFTRAHGQAYARTTTTIPSSILWIKDDKLITFGGHDHPIASNCLGMWEGREGRLGIVTDRNELVEVEVTTDELIPKTTIGRLSFPGDDGADDGLAISDGASVVVARTQAKWQFYSVSQSLVRRLIISRHRADSEAELVYRVDEDESDFVLVRSMATVEDSVLVVVANDQDERKAILLRPES